MAAPKHRAVRPRYGRVVAVGASASVVAVALLGSAAGWGDEAAPHADVSAVATSSAARSSSVPSSTSPSSTSPSAAAPSSTAAPTAGAEATTPPDPTALPADSGDGKRIVFDQSAQRVWLVDDDDRVQRTYLGSGSVVDNLRPGTYSVYSRSRWAVGVDDSGAMQFFVRFAKGPGGAAIGFHTIPTKHGVPLQEASQLGTPQSHGCIRQRRADAVALWHFAPVGTRVVVVA
jgi:lipoprotein-anchoring transpeptidase ErfK/SrfK